MKRSRNNFEAGDSQQDVPRASKTSKFDKTSNFDNTSKFDKTSKFDLDRNDCPSFNRSVMKKSILARN